MVLDLKIVKTSSNTNNPTVNQTFNNHLTTKDRKTSLTTSLIINRHNTIKDRLTSLIKTFNALQEKNWNARRLNALTLAEGGKAQTQANVHL